MSVTKQTYRVVGEYNDESWYSGVSVNGKHITPARSLKLRNHSPTGFAWGYDGSGPAQLALALLLEFGIPESEAMHVYQEFKRAFIASLPVHGNFDVTIEIGINKDVFVFLDRERKKALSVSRPFIHAFNNPDA